MTITAPQFKITTGNGVWFDLYHSVEDLNDKTAILDEDGSLLEAFANLDEGTPVTNFEKAKQEAKDQFYGHKWTISNGRIAFTKGDKEPHEVTPEIFSTGKVAMPETRDSAVYRNEAGELIQRMVERGKEVIFNGTRDRASEVATRLGV